jgi:hypothetical protein
MPNNESVDIFGRRRRHPEKRIDCAAKRERRPSVRTMIKNAEKDGKKVSGATVAADGSVSLQFGEAEPSEASNPWDAEIEKLTKQ